MRKKKATHDLLGATLVVSPQGSIPPEDDQPRFSNSTPGLSEHGAMEGVVGPSSAQENKGQTKTRPPMRSSIACLRCRRSKIKCNNDGGENPCETCLKSGQKCQYPEVTPLPPKRKETSTGRNEKEGGNERKRARKMEDAFNLGSDRGIAHAEEATSYPFLTDEVWDQVFSIYKLHFATELPFLHLPSLKEKISQRRMTNGEKLPDLKLVLLGILALTARFHPDIVKYVAHLTGSQGGSGRPKSSQSAASPLAASEYFANVLENALGPLKTSIAVGSIERVQAFLMLAIHELSQHRGNLGAWMYAGVAIRMAQALNLGRESRAPGQLPNDQGRHSMVRDTMTSSEHGIMREVKRRTMFSCLILDRMLSCGSERTAIIRTEYMRVQLPCTEMAFDLAMEVQTGFLGSSIEDRKRHINDDSVLSRFIQLIDIWGRISQYVVAGGRAMELYAPWDERSTFKRLRDELDGFNHDLPETFTLSRQNYYRHDNHQATSMYISLHMLGSLCQIVLHREYLPFLPLRCDGPRGPLDRWSYLNCPGEDQFWRSSAASVFRAARDILSLVEICRDKLPQSRIVLSALWTAGLMGVYGQHFPAMDTQCHMTSQDDSDRRESGDMDVFSTPLLSLVSQTLGKMAQNHSSVGTILAFMREQDEYIKHVKEDYRKRIERPRTVGQQYGSGLPTRREQSVPVDWNTHVNKLRLDDDRASHSAISRGSSMERSSSVGPLETFHAGNDCLHSRISTPVMSFTAINNPELERPPHADMTPPIAHVRAEDGRRSDHHHQHRHVHKSSGTSMASVSGGSLAEPSPSQAGAKRYFADAPLFSMDHLDRLESWRIAVVLNDLPAFAGASCLGENAWDDW